MTPSVTLARPSLRRPAVLRSRNSLIVAGLLLLVIVAFGVAPTPYSPNAQLTDGLSPIGLPLGPSLHHPFGTDTLGRDQLSRAIVGGRISLLVGTLGSLCATTIGAAVGLVAGYRRRIVGTALMRLTDIVMAFPYLLLAVALQAVIGPGVSNLLIVIAAVTWVNAARVVNALALTESQRDYVDALEVLGASRTRIVVRHLLPNLSAPILVLFSTGVGYTILLEATMSYLGLGVQPPTATWGNMIRDGQAYFQSAPWLVIVPGFLVVATVVAFNVVGDRVGDLRGAR